MVFLFGAGDEESAEAPPAADEARRFRGSIPTASRGRGWELVDTTVSAGEKAKKITTQMGGDLWSGRRGSNSLPGIPRMAVAIRRSPASPLDLTRFAQVEAASSPVLRHIPKRIPHPVGWGILFVIAHHFCCQGISAFCLASRTMRRKLCTSITCFQPHRAAKFCDLPSAPSSG